MKNKKPEHALEFLLNEHGVSSKVVRVTHERRQK